jgi:membrane protein YqaA with SNARE-associated domain
MGTLVVAFVGCLLSAFVPIPPAEPLLVGLGLRVDQPFLLAGLALAGAAGQMCGKTVFYLLGCGALRLVRLRVLAAKRPRPERFAAKIWRWVEGHPRAHASVLLLSALTGVPPLTASSLMAGSLNMRWLIFFLCGLAGRWLRFCALLALLIG